MPIDWSAQINTDQIEREEEEAKKNVRDLISKWLRWRRRHRKSIRQGTHVWKLFGLQLKVCKRHRLHRNACTVCSGVHCLEFEYLFAFARPEEKTRLINSMEVIIMEPPLLAPMSWRPHHFTGLFGGTVISIRLSIQFSNTAVEIDFSASH